MFTTIAFTGEFRKTNDDGKTKIAVAKVAIDVSDNAPNEFEDFVDTLRILNDDNKDLFDEYDHTFDGTYFLGIEDVIFEFSNYFTIRWVDVRRGDKDIVELENLYDIDYVFEYFEH